MRQIMLKPEPFPRERLLETDIAGGASRADMFTGGARAGAG